MKRFLMTATLVVFFFTGFSQTLFPYLSNKTYGFADQDGNLKIQPKYVDAKIMIGGVAAVNNGVKWGAINADGKEIIGYEYDEISTVKNGEVIYLELILKGKKGLASTEGKILVPANFSKIHFYNNAFIGCNKGTCTMYSASGKKLNTIENVSVIYDETQKILYAIDSKTVFFYNAKGKAFAEVKNYKTIEPLAQDFMVVKTGENMTIVSNRGVLLEEENSITEAKYIDLWAKAKTKNGWGLANAEGWVLEPKYEDVKRLNEYLLAAKLGGKWALFNWDGKEQSEFNYARVDKIKGTDKFIKAYTSTNWNLVEANGTPTKINNVYALNIKALDRAGIPFKQKLWGVTSLDKGVIIDPIYKKLFTTKLGNFIVEMGDRYGLISPKGKEIIKPKYDKIIEKDKVFLASLDYDHYIFDNNGKQLLKQGEVWDKQDYLPVGFYGVKRDKKQAVYYKRTRRIRGCWSFYKRNPWISRQFTWQRQGRGCYLHNRRRRHKDMPCF